MSALSEVIVERIVTNNWGYVCLPSRGSVMLFFPQPYDVMQRGKKEKNLTWALMSIIYIFKSQYLLAKSPKCWFPLS